MRQEKDRVRAREMFRQMTPREKTVHIFQYYWLHMLVAVFLTIVAVSLATAWHNNLVQKDYLYIGLQEGYSAELEPAIYELAGQAEWPEGFNILPVASADSGKGMGTLQLSMYLAADELDFIVCDQDTMELILMDETNNCSSVPLAQTALANRVNSSWELFVLTFHDTGRGEKTEKFATILMGH